jgi:hypothetical protein
LSLLYDSGSQFVAKTAIEIGPAGHTNVNVQALLDDQDGTGFDLRVFGFSPAPNNADTRQYHRAFRASAQHNALPYDILFTEEAETTLVTSLAPEPQRLFIDILTLRATVMLVAKRMWGKDMLAQYSLVFLLAFTVRAQIEKTMLMFAHLDPALNYPQLDASKKIRSVFLRQARGSSWEPTLRLAALLESVDILDDMYRSPEIHKTGRSVEPRLLWAL